MKYVIVRGLINQQFYVGGGEWSLTKAKAKRFMTEKDAQQIIRKRGWTFASFIPIPEGGRTGSTKKNQNKKDQAWLSNLNKRSHGD